MAQIVFKVCFNRSTNTVFVVVSNEYSSIMLYDTAHNKKCHQELLSLIFISSQLRMAQTKSNRKKNKVAHESDTRSNIFCPVIYNDIGCDRYTIERREACYFDNLNKVYISSNRYGFLEDMTWSRWVR